MELNHDHWVTVIDTKDPELYKGPRIAVFHTLAEASEDIVEWINDELGTYYREADKAVEAYGSITGRFAKIEELAG